MSADMDSDVAFRGQPARVAPAPSAPAVTVQAPTCENQVVSYPLVAGQFMDAGVVTIQTNGDVLTVTFASTWDVLETHLEVSADVPTQRGAPGRYAHNGFASEDGLTYTLSLSELGINTGDTFYVLAHAVVGAAYGTETAYAGDIQSGRGAWYGVMGYNVVVPDCVVACEVENTFPVWAQSISHVTLVFENAPGVYRTVKIDGWPNGHYDLNDYIDAIVSYLVANDAEVNESSVLLGAVIKGGTQVTAFFNYGCYNGGLPAGAGITFLAANGNDQGAQVTYLYGQIF